MIRRRSPRVRFQNPFKPITKKQEKASRTRLEAAARDRCRETAWQRDGGRCVRCGRPVTLRLADCRHEFEVAHINEIVPRSLGGDPTNVANAETLCLWCHLGRGHHVASLTKEPLDG